MIFIVRMTPHTSVTGVWNFSYSDYQTANNGVDILEYIYVNNESARTAVNNNRNGVTSHAGASGWLANGGSCAPVFAETNSEGIVVRIDIDYSTTSFNFTLKAGLSLLNPEGKFSTVTEDVGYTYKDGTLAESPKTVAMDDKISIGTWSEAEPGITWMHVGFSGFSVAGADWHIADSKIDSNNGVDPLEYVIINGKTAREHYVGDNTSLTVITATNWVEAFIVKVSKTYLDLGEFTFQLKAGFTLVGADEKVYVLQNDTAIYGWDNGNFGQVTEHITPSEPEVPELEEVDVTDTVKIEFAKAEELESKFKIFIAPASILTTNSAWNISDWKDNLISANNGVDIMNYIYINDQNIRELSDNNRINNTYPLGDIEGGWFANSNQCRPVFVETAGDGIWVSVLHTFSSKAYTVTLKAGLALLNSEGVISVINRDVSFYCENGNVTKIEERTLSFEGLGETKTVVSGQPIGELPAVPYREGCDGVWTIDGVEINENTVYNYGANKTAVAIYKTDVTDSVRIEYVVSGEHESKFKIFITPSSSLTTEGWWNIYGDRLIAANNGVDIMDYIYVNGQNIRELSDDNRVNNTYPLGNGTGWLGNSDQCRPVFVETNGEGIWVTVLHSFSSTNYTVTLKEGFSILNSEGYVSVIKKDVTFACDGTTGATVAKKEYTLSFEGYSETISVVTGDPIGALPPAPAKDGYDGAWAIDGVRITEDSIYNYNENKTAVAVYSVNITKSIQIENRNWGAHEGEYYLGVLDMREKNAVVNGDTTTYYLNTPLNLSDCWYHGNDVIIATNNGVDIMQYIYINDKSARDLITENVNGANLKHDCNGNGQYGGDDYDCWLSNPAAYPVYVETSVGSGIMIRVAKAYVGDYFEITIKRGFSIINNVGDVVYVDEDVTYKLLNLSDGESLSKGEITDEDLATVGGKIVTLKNGDVTYLTKSTAGIILPNIEGTGDGLGIKQVLIGWTTDPDNLTNLYPVGYTMAINSETTLYAVWLGFEMENGAAVRLAEGSSGIRFSVNLNTNDYGIGVSNGLILETGTILCPTTYLVNGRELTHSALIGSDPTVQYYAEKVAEIFTEKDGVTTYATAFVNIKAKDFSRQYSARGYLKIKFTTGEGYVYTDYNAEENSRSIYEVATKAYNDEENPSYKTNETILNYINKVLDITWDYSFEKAEGAIGTAIINGDVAIEGQQVTIPFTGDIESVLINGSRLVAGSNVNVKLGDLVFSFIVSEFDSDSITFTIGAALDTNDKESDEALHFVSPDEDLDFFLNDFFKRHTGVVEDGERQNVNSTVAGKTAEEFFNAEWTSMTYYWYNGVTGYTDENGNYENRIAGLNSYLANVPVDDYGYVWSSNDRVRDPDSEVSTGEQKMGWPFPNNDTVKTAHFEFNGSDKGSMSSNVGAKTNGGLYTANVSNQSSNIAYTLTFPATQRVYTFYAPLLEFEVRIEDATNVSDIVVWYTTKDSTSFSEDKKVSVKALAFEDYKLGSATGEFNHILYLPMYSQTAWGESTSNYLKQIKIEIALKSGTTISGDVGLNYVRPTLDTRMSNNNSVFISSLRTAYDYTGDIDFLVSQMTRARKAYNFLMQMYDSTRCLKKESYLVGHGGNKEDTNWLGNATSSSIANSISQGYWDIMYMPEYDFQSNLYFQKALQDMAYLEQVMVDSGNKTISAAAVRVKTAKRGGGTGYSTYASVAGANAQYAAENITDYQGYNLAAIQANVEESKTSGGFWDATDGRFVAGYGYNPDKNANVVYDYGYVAWNLEAIYYGIATEDQARAIMNWLASEGNLYKYDFAPLSITKTGDANALNGEYAARGNKWVNCQFGGAILYTSFYDIMARLEVNGSGDAFDRLQAIQAWYKEVYDYYVANGSDPYDFYRYYYDSKGIQMQGVGDAGAIGIDREFLESSLPLASVAYGFFGIDSVDGKALEIAPELPSELRYWKMENLAFNYYKYDLKIYANAIQLSNVEALKEGLSTEGLTINVVLDYVNGQSVYVNGIKLESGYTINNDKVTVSGIPFGAVVVEVR
ncbi:MAG: hypothetical protein IKA99_00555 [Clostridia bacterium]|nr:hypothetical protein [Clostridia bacterium]